MAVVLEDKVREIIAEQLMVKDDEVTDAATFEGLGADSLDMVELVMQFEEAFDLEIPDEDVDRIKTVGDVVSYVKARAR